MTIEQELTKLNTNLTDSYTAVSNKGGTLPASENFDNLPNAINSITELKGETRTVTPTTSQQTITPSSGKNGITQVTVNAVTSAIDNNITAGNIKSGVSILGVNGTVTELAGETRTVSLTSSSSSGQTFTPSSGKNGITSITVKANNQARTVTPTTSQQSITVNSGYSGNGTITVNAVTSSIDSDIVAGNIKSGVNILGVNGTLTPANNTSLSITPTTSAQSFTPSSPYTGYSPVTVNAVTSSIDSNISAGNIKSGVSILGVSGSVTELKGETRSVSIASTAGNTFTPSSGKNGITSITVTPTNQAKTITPTTLQQSISVPSGYSGFGSLTVNAVTSSIDANITAGNIKNGVTILGITGTYVGGVTLTVEIRNKSNNNLVSDTHNIVVDGISYTVANGTLDIEVPKNIEFNWYMPYSSGYSYKFTPSSGTLTLSENYTLTIQRAAQIF